jgi:hypothetical protein
LGDRRVKGDQSKKRRPIITERSAERVQRHRRPCSPGSQPVGR